VIFSYIHCMTEKNSVIPNMYTIQYRLRYRLSLAFHPSNWYEWMLVNLIIKLLTSHWIEETFIDKIYRYGFIDRLHVISKDMSLTTWLHPHGFLSSTWWPWALAWIGHTNAPLGLCTINCTLCTYLNNYHFRQFICLKLEYVYW
jgi:hypothetical protein